MSKNSLTYQAYNANRETIAGSNLLQASASLAASGRAVTLKSSGNFCRDDYNLREVKSDDGKAVMKTVYTEWEEQSTHSAQVGYAEQAILLQRRRSNPEISVDRHQYICYKVSDLQRTEPPSTEKVSTPERST